MRRISHSGNSRPTSRDGVDGRTMAQSLFPLPPQPAVSWRTDAVSAGDGVLKIKVTLFWSQANQRIGRRRRRQAVGSSTLLRRRRKSPSILLGWIMSKGRPPDSIVTINSMVSHLHLVQKFLFITSLTGKCAPCLPTLQTAL